MAECTHLTSTWWIRCSENCLRKKSKVQKQTKKPITFSVFHICSGRSLNQLGASDKDREEMHLKQMAAGGRLGRAAQLLLSSGEGAAAVTGKPARGSPAAAAAAAAPAPAQFPLSPALTLRAHAHCARSPGPFVRTTRETEKKKKRKFGGKKRLIGSNL